MSEQAEFDFNARKEEAREASAAVKARIAKLLRLAADKRGNQHEAERALQMAYELAEKHRVDVGALDLDDETARLVHEYWPVGERYDQLRRGVFGILRNFFHVTTCFDRPRMLIVGKPSDLMIARYVHDFLLRAGRACLREYERGEKAKRRKVTSAKRSGYLAGFIYGVTAKLLETKKTLPLTDGQSALIVSEDQERERKMEELVPERSVMQTRKVRRNKGAVWAGYVDGRATDINRPLAGAPGAALLLK